MQHTISYSAIEAAHAAWTDAAAQAEPGAVRLLFTIGMKAVRAALAPFLEERNQLTLEFADRDGDGNPVPERGVAGVVIPGRVVITNAAPYLAKLMELHAQSVSVELPPLTEDLLCRTSASAESLAVLLDFVATSEATP